MKLTYKMDAATFFEALADAAREGIRIGKQNTAGDYTEEGISYNVWNDFRDKIIEDEGSL